MRHMTRGSARLVKLAVAATVLAGSALGPLVIGAPTAVAQTTSSSNSLPSAYAAGASGTALVLSLAGNSLTAGVSGAEATSAPEAKAEADGVLTPALTAAKQALVTSLSGTQSEPSSCATPAVPSFPEIGSLLSLGLACSSASATEQNGQPSASSTGSVAGLSVGLGNLLKVLNPSVLSNTPLGGALKTILGKLPSLPTGGLPLLSVLSGLKGALTGASGSASPLSPITGLLGNLTALLSVKLGPTQSSVVKTGDVITAKASASGATVEVLPNATGSALITVKVGPAQATVTSDPHGAPIGTSTGAIVSVTLDVPAVGAKTIPISPGQETTLLAGTPLATTIALGSSHVTQSAGPTTTATASGLTLDLLQGLDGGIDLTLGHISAVVDAPPITTSSSVLPAAPSSTSSPTSTSTPLAIATPVSTATTVHTGEPWAGSAPFLGGGLVLGIALATSPLWRRRLIGLLARKASKG